jgi:tetratricopeptide (TPR) repeat protein
MNNSINSSYDDDSLVKEYIARGKGLFNDGQIEKAFKYFNKAILLNSEYSQTYFVKAQAHIEIYEVDEAEKCLEKFLKLVPDDPRGYLKLIDINDLTGDFDNCIYYCKKLLETQGENIDLYFQKVEFLALLNAFKKANERP